jgi:CxxC motif-containing protein (DUF1111 family)
MKEPFEFVVLKRLPLLFFVLAVGFATAGDLNQDQSASDNLDPGPRGGSPGAGGPLSGLSQDLQNLFNAAKSRFQEINSVSGTIEPGNGLGPRFNGNSCAMCHIQPVLGGTSPAVNPQIAVANLDGATNAIPSFISASGSIREARFVSNQDGTPDGGVHDLFTITGRPDAAGCTLAQPDFADALAQHNVVFRIPTSLFGAGLVEGISDAAIYQNAATDAEAKRLLGISGHANTSGNDGTITKFGWKAQNKSLEIFAGEAYNVEQGVTNELFPNERDPSLPKSCIFNATPEDTVNLASSGSISLTSDYLSDSMNFAKFMQLSAPPTPVASTTHTAMGEVVFRSVGCALCHTPTVNSGPTTVNPFTNQTNVPVNAFSDFLVHHMGVGLADGVTQGSAGPDEFRTAPLWGLGQRLFFLHDGRTSNLVEAIREHQSRGSEANRVIDNFENLARRDKQNLILFLRSL